MNLSSLDLNLLRVLDALLREGSTVAAGKRIGLSQPAVSAALGRLRVTLDDPLFVRHGQRLRPTRYAKSLEMPLRAALDDLQRILSGPSVFDPQQADNLFKISGADFFATMLMPQLAARLGRDAPRMRAQLVDLVPDNYIATLERYEIDLALIPDAKCPEWCDFTPAFVSDYVVIARNGNQLVNECNVESGTVMPLDLFCTLKHILFSPEGRLSAQGDKALEAVGRSRDVVMTMPFFAGVCQAVAGSENIALVPQRLAEQLAPQMGFNIYRPPVTIEPATLYMVWHRRETLSPAHKWFRELILEILTPLNTRDLG